MIKFVSNQTKIKTAYTLAKFGEVIEYFKDKTYVQVDTETTGWFDHNNTILLLQLGDYDTQYVIEFMTLSKEQRQILTDEILNNQDKIKILQNAKFDIKFLWRHGMDICNVYDTMLAEAMLHNRNDLPKGFLSLYRIVKHYAGFEMDKSVRADIARFGISDRVIEYAANDVKYLEIVLKAQMPELIKLGLAEEDTQNELTVLGLENRATIAIACIEYNGMYLDTAKWNEVKEEIIILREQILKELDELVIDDPKLQEYVQNYVDLFTSPELRTSINWNSPIQKKGMLSKIIPDIPDTNMRTLDRYKKDYPIVKKLIEYSKTNKLYTSFAKPLIEKINNITGRIHTSFWQMLVTGRVSCSNPNLQQIPSRSPIGKKMRNCFVPESGYKIVGGDFSG